MSENKTEKPCKLERPTQEKIIALGIEEIATILAAVLDIRSGTSIGIIEGAKFSSVRTKAAIVIPGRPEPKPIPCVVLRLRWEEEKQDDSPIPN